MQTPNQVLPAATASAYFPNIPPETAESPVFQDLLDDAMAIINETIGLDLSAGPGVPVTQVFQPDATANSMLRMVVPMDAAQPLTVQTGPDQRTMQTWEYTAYVNMIRAGGVWSNYYYFDRGHSFNTNFPAPVTVTYTPRDSVYRLIKQAMLDLVRLEMAQLRLDGSPTAAGFAMISAIKDDQQEIDFSNSLKLGDFETARQLVLSSLLLKLRGPRIG
jgi:hypothetical protein